MRYQLGLYEKALPDYLTWEEKLKAAKDAGYDFLEMSIDESEIRLSRLNWSKEERLELVELTKRVGIPISSICLSGHRKYPLGSKDIVTREKSLEIADKAIDLACDLGVRIIQLAGYDVYYEASNDDTVRYFEENLRLITEMASAKSVTLGFETMETEFMDTVDKAMKYVNMINSPYLNIYPDIGNLNNAAIKYSHDIIEDLEEGRGRISAMHLKESKPGHYRNLLFGQGHVDFNLLCEQAYNMSVNRFVTEFWNLGNENYQEEIKDQILFVRNILDEIYGR